MTSCTDLVEEVVHVPDVAVDVDCDVVGAHVVVIALGLHINTSMKRH